MDRYDGYKDTLIVILRKHMGVDKQGNPVSCDDLYCENCQLNYACCDGGLCVNENHKTALDWLKAEYTEPPVDWAKVEVDTPVLVSEDGEIWYNRYFAYYSNGIVYTWVNGQTHWSVNNPSQVNSWDYAKLADGTEFSLEHRNAVDYLNKELSRNKRNIETRRVQPADKYRVEAKIKVPAIHPWRSRSKSRNRQERQACC